MKFIAFDALQLLPSIATFGALIILIIAPAAAASIDPDFAPGYRFVQAYTEDGSELNSKGIDLGWAAINRHGFELDLGTGLRTMKRDFNGQLFGGWTAYLAITAPWQVAPYLEIGFDAGEVLGEILTDRAVENTKGRNWIDPDAFVGMGLRISLTRRVQLKAYHKLHYIESKQYQAVGSGVSGLALVLRFPRRHLEWWQIPP